MNAPTQRAETTALTTAADAVPYGLAPTATIGSTAMILNPDHMRQMMAVAESMAQAVVTVPKHLQGKPGDCLAIVMQATQWNMNPYSVAQKTHVVNGTLGYEAQLVHAVLQGTGAIEGTFTYEFKGDNNTLQCRVGAVCAGDKDLTWGEWLSIGLVTTKNSPLWKTNPKQQMGYLQVKNWARAFKPGAILGVYTTDELESLPPKNMGAAEIVPPTIPPELLKVARAAADKGRAAFSDWWAKALPPERSLLTAEVTDLKKRVEAFEAGRTVDNQAAQATAQDQQKVAATTPPADGSTAGANTEFVATYANVLEEMVKAAEKKDLDGLDIAADWIGEIHDAEQRKELGAKYEELKAEITGGAKP